MSIPRFITRRQTSTISIVDSAAMPRKNLQPVPEKKRATKEVETSSDEDGVVRPIRKISRCGSAKGRSARKHLHLVQDGEEALKPSNGLPPAEEPSDEKIEQPSVSQKSDKPYMWSDADFTQEKLRAYNENFSARLKQHAFASRSDVQLPEIPDLESPTTTIPAAPQCVHQLDFRSPEERKEPVRRDDLRLGSSHEPKLSKPKKKRAINFAEDSEE